MHLVAHLCELTVGEFLLHARRYHIYQNHLEPSARATLARAIAFARTQDC